MKKVILSLIAVSALGSLASAATTNINCVTPDGKIINLTVLVDHERAFQAQMEVISPLLYAKKAGNSSGAMNAIPKSVNGRYWYSANDSFDEYGYGIYLTNQLLFQSSNNVQAELVFGPEGKANSDTVVYCTSQFEE